MTTKKSIYTSEFKSQAIALVREAGQSSAKVARDLEINVNTLYNWLSSSTGTSAKNECDEKLSTENKRLKKELAQAELERDILKKAAAYFAKETL